MIKWLFKAIILFVAMIKSWVDVIVAPFEIVIDIIASLFVIKYIIIDFIFHREDFWNMMTASPNVLHVFLIVGFFSSRILYAILRNANKGK